MAGVPRLSPRVEHLMLRALCGLPPRTQRLLFGRPPSVDGQRLALDIHAMLRLAHFVGRETLTGGLPPVQARAEVLADARAGCGRPIPMASVRELEIPGPAVSLPARLYLPHAAQPPPRPLLLYFHGGGWVVGDLETHDSVCRFLAAHSGATILSCDYRLAPEHPYPAAVEDAQAAYRWTVEHAAELGADPDRIGIGGDSAGGNMATGVCIAMRDDGGPQPAMQLLIYPVTDAIGEQRSRELFGTGFQLTTSDIVEFERCYLPDPSYATDPLASVLRAPSLADLPPAYVVTAGFDPLRDEGEEYAERMREEGVRVSLRRYASLTHSFANMTAFSRSARAAMLETAGALRMGLA
ncbi:MAG TPA: alpha/beta hydrolase [Solirubrobacterales bacterium]